MIGWYPQLVVQGTITHDKNQQANNNQIWSLVCCWIWQSLLCTLVKFIVFIWYTIVGIHNSINNQHCFDSCLDIFFRNAKWMSTAMSNIWWCNVVSFDDDFSVFITWIQFLSVLLSLYNTTVCLLHNTIKTFTFGLIHCTLNCYWISIF